MSALRDTFSKENLVANWRMLRSRIPRRTTPGVDGVTRDEFSASIESEIDFISTSVRSGSFRFQPLRPLAIPKGDGDIRLINVPTIRDRFVQRVMSVFLVERYGNRWRLPNSFSSMPGEDEGVHSTLRSVSSLLRRSDFVVKADLSKYFDTIPRSEIKKTIKTIVRHRSLHSLIFAVIDCETSTRSDEESAIFRKSGLKKGAGLRQGMPLSPILSYVYLMDVDRQMASGFFRYVDDLLFIGKTRDVVLDQFNSYREIVESRGLVIHAFNEPKGEAKTSLIGPKESFDYLGVTLNRDQDTVKFFIPKKSKVRIEKQIIESTQLDNRNRYQQKGWVISTSLKAANLVRNYRGAYDICEDWPEFERILKNLQLNMCRRIVRQLASVNRTADKELLLRVFGI